METKTTKLEKKRSVLERISFLIGVTLSFLLPIFIIPVNTFPFLASKNLVLFLSVIMLFLLWVFERIKNKDFLVSKNILVISAYLVPISYLISSLFSSSTFSGLVGKGFETNNFIFILSLFLLMFLISKSFKSEIQVLYLYTGLILSALLMMTVHGLRLFFGPTFLSLGILNNITANLLGSWNELGIFFGLVALISLAANEYLGKSRFIKIFSFVSLGLSLFFVWLVNFNLVWVFLMLSSLFLVICSIFLNNSKNKYSNLYKKTSPYIFAVTLMFFFMSGELATLTTPSLFGVSNFEVYPSVYTTLNIAKSTLASDPILGVGPNNFVNQWSSYKPQIVNETEFWNIDFNTGTSFILSSLITIGLLGFISWVLFILSIVYFGFKLIKKSRDDELSHFVVISLFISVIYLLLFIIFYAPGAVILGLTFLILGVIFSFLQQKNIISITKISFNNSAFRKVSFVLVMLIFLGGSFLSGFLFFKKVNASVSYNKGFVAINNEQDFVKGYGLIMEATSKYPVDLYFRSLTDLNLIQLRNVLNQKDVTDEVLREQFQEVFSASINSAQRAVQIAPKNYLNLLTLAKVYGSVVPLQIEGTYEKSLEIYLEAIKLNSTNPLLVLNLANLEIANGDLEKAKKYTEVAIQMKNNYSDAYYLLSQLKFNEGNTEEAVKVIESLSLVTPNDPEVFLQLGVFNYEKANYERAKSFLERAVVLSPYYSNAKYLLGLTYDFIGEKDKAVGQFNDLKILNPNNENVEIILKNIESGRNPFYGFEQPQQISEIIQEESSENQSITEEDTLEINTEQELE